jgi:hypothetical protein
MLVLLCCRVTKQDISKGRKLDAWSMQEDEQEQTQQKMFNPPLVHAIAVPATSDQPAR